MRKQRLTIVAAVLLGCVLWLSCGKQEKSQPDSQASDEGKKTVYVVNYPLQYFAERIGGDEVAVHFPAPSDEDPAFWMPAPETIAQYQEADLVLLNGATYAKWTEKVSLTESRIVNTSAAFSDRYLQIAKAVTHSHGPGGEHSHAGTDFNTWLDPQLAILQAQTVKDALVDLLPEHEALFNTNMTQLEIDLLALDSAFQALVTGREETPLVASHPVYGYFAHKYGLNLQARLWEPEKMPSDEEWQDFDHSIEHHPAKWMIWEGTPDSAIAVKLKEHGLDGVVFLPCGNIPEEGDYIQVMQQNVGRLKPAFE
ncbi:MAG: zinc ABC transporter substrate-binding protein [Candidatus Zixiibacteriota bacterium]|nr:MAG: zinc ABC transporter substrate-binding protein [candidate division Zixibacteria bacterium]